MTWFDNNIIIINGNVCACVYTTEKLGVYIIQVYVAQISIRCTSFLGEGEDYERAAVGQVLYTSHLKLKVTFFPNKRLHIIMLWNFVSILCILTSITLGYCTCIAMIRYADLFRYRYLLHIHEIGARKIYLIIILLVDN